MKILSICSKAYPFAARGEVAMAGGAQITNLTFLSALSRFGHECRLLTRFPVPRSARCKGVRIGTFRDLQELRGMMEAIRPDVLAVGLGVSSDAARLGHHLGIPSLIYHHAYECCPPTVQEKEAWGLASGEDWLQPHQTAWLREHTSRSAACSRYLQKFARGRGAVCHRVIYPMFDPAPSLRGVVRGSAVTAVCGYPYKGASILLALAERFPRQVFRLAGNIDPALRSLFAAHRNISILGPVLRRHLFDDTAVAIIPSQWPEPFGRVAVEAMAEGIPILASSAGGLVEAAAAPELQVADYRSAGAWADRLDQLLSSDAARRANTAAGSESARRFIGDLPAEQLESELLRIASSGRNRSRRPRRVIALCGEDSAKTAFALVNANWSKARTLGPGTRFLSLPNPTAPCSVPVDVYIQHDYSRNFAKVEFPEEGKVAAVRTWDFGPFPPAWVEKINTQCDQLWVHTHWIRENAIRGGVHPGKVFVVPLGFDPSVFRPGGSVRRLGTGKSFHFVFVGRTVIRKGVDILLKAYVSAFTPKDDVALVIKDNPRDVFYQGIDLRDRILSIAGTPGNPAIHYIDHFLSKKELAALYRACDVGVFPYRAEGFCLPILEAMASGVPCIVPEFGACLDFCSARNSYPVRARRIQLPVTGSFAINTLGFEEEVREVDFCEMPAEALAEQMRAVYDSRDAVAAKGLRAAKTAHSRFTWRNSREAVKTCLARLSDSTDPERLVMRRRLFQKNEKALDAARSLFLARMQPGTR